MPVEEEDAEIAQTTVQSLVCLPRVECPGQEGGESQSEGVDGDGRILTSYDSPA